MKMKNFIIKGVKLMPKMDAESENLQNTKFCRVDKETPCVQYPDDDCGCNPCETCEVAIIYERMKSEN